jgi:hypothetical protein
MSEAIESRLSRLESGQAEIEAWRREMQEAFRESWRRGEDLDRRLGDTERLIQQISEEARQRERELDRRFQETDRRFQETDRMIKELGQQIGGLGQKFSGFTEGMAMPSMERRSAERFGTTGFAVRPRVRIGDEELEVDAIAYSEGEPGTVCAVDVKSRLRDEGIDQLLRSLERFPRFFPEHRGKRLVGVLAAVDASLELEQRALREGLVLARISGDVFELRLPEGYEPRSFPNPAVPVA